MSQTRKLISILSASALVVLAAVPALAAPRVFLPDGKATRPGSGWIPVSVQTGVAAGVPIPRIQLTLTGDDGSKMSFYFSDADTHVVDAMPSSTINCHLNGWLLRPEHYAITAAVGEQTSLPASLTLTDPIEGEGGAHTVAGGNPSDLVVGTPIVLRDYTLQTAPLTVNFTVDALDATGAPLTADCDIRVTVTAPDGTVRHSFSGQAHLGVLHESLPLAVNDVPGVWTVTAVTAADKPATAKAHFNLPAVTNPGAVAGVSNRAVYFGDDRAKIFSFFRVHNNVTIVQGTSGFSHDQAQRLASIMQRWNVTSNVVDAGGSIPDGPVVLVGNPSDNPLIASLAKTIPATLDAGAYPGPYNGLIGYSGERPGGEIVYAIGYDPDGLKEAVGSIYEAATGMDPLTPFVLPGMATVDATAGRPIGRPGV